MQNTLPQDTHLNEVGLAATAKSSTDSVKKKKSVVNDARSASTSSFIKKVWRGDIYVPKANLTAQRKSKNPKVSVIRLDKSRKRRASL